MMYMYYSQMHCDNVMYVKLRALTLIYTNFDPKYNKKKNNEMLGKET